MNFKNFFCHSLPYSYSSFILSVNLYSKKNTSVSFLNCTFFQFSPSLLCLFQRLESHLRRIYLYHSSISHTHKKSLIQIICIHNTFFFWIYSQLVLIKWISTKNPRGKNQIKLYSTYFNLIKYYPRKSSTSFLGRFMIPRLWWFIEGRVLMGAPKIYQITKPLQLL